MRYKNLLTKAYCKEQRAPEDGSMFRLIWRKNSKMLTCKQKTCFRICKCHNVYELTVLSVGGGDAKPVFQHL